jgi:hypothetical protein
MRGVHQVIAERDHKNRQQDKAPGGEEQPPGVKQVSSIAEHIAPSGILAVFVLESGAGEMSRRTENVL